ncbi:hypothetical protein HNY73_021610 [Argiope bruennichi]|uniref:Uncharacterized protein n=1 Tax=Argiope bruennichi TaxID=94029 RepID=A0A8T0DZ15_ARGBR|nr:hypothetical protein HNY73_021610 [Argiope bruennichi]
MLRSAYTASGSISNLGVPTLNPSTPFLKLVSGIGTALHYAYGVHISASGSVSNLGFPTLNPSTPFLKLVSGIGTALHYATECIYCIWIRQQFRSSYIESIYSFP